MASISAPVDLSPLSIRIRPLSRLGRLLGGLVLYGASMGFMVRAQLGLDPWDVLHQGLAQRLGWSFGTITALTGAVVLLAWLPLRQRPGIGTVANVVVIAVAVDATLALTPPVDPLLAQIVLMIIAIVLNGIATAVYVGARLGPGPRDGLMTGLHARTDWSVRVVRTVIELCVLSTGWLLGGTVGVGTVAYALAIGPLTQFFLRFATVREKKDLCP
ncbi:hypothetical protein MOQ72_27355 [Saccharopolyspora sp. K220]|uniref:membrane protein YczE n=1 Tax=Saccharopolyspora soli TaxID=2926618 RepID=UPI001F5A4F71|nr:hypothetical protein [Saccharopolyspora soli]MCI2421167.1 hypothetical protein [Saccharopolyspora soli]